VSKEERRALKQQHRAEKRMQREQRKRERQEKKQRLEEARVAGLPSKEALGASDTLVVHVDGYNIIGCDAQCRRFMRGKNGGMRRARQRMTHLVETGFIGGQLPYGVQTHLWFDGNGEDHVSGGLRVAFSGKQQIVDDKLVEMFAASGKAKNANQLVVTSDRALTLRLYDLGVKVMKSGEFYRQFLADKEEEEEEKKPQADEMEVDGTETANDEDQFWMVMATKLVQTQLPNDGDETGDDTKEEEDTDDDDDDDDEEMEAEGQGQDNNPTDDMDNDEDDDAPDAEFTTIFGEDFEFVDTEKN